jgi:hypothetical protein
MGYLTPLVWTDLGPEGGTPHLHGRQDARRYVAYPGLGFVLGKLFALKKRGKAGFYIYVVE